MMQRTNYNGFPLADYNTTPGNGYGFPVPATGASAPSEMEPTSLTQARMFNTPEGGSDRWDLYSLGVHWTTDVGKLVSSTAYFDRKVDETENEAEFLYAVVTSGAGGSPEPSSIEEIKNYQRFVEEVRFLGCVESDHRVALVYGEDHLLHYEEGLVTGGGPAVVSPEITWHTPWPRRVSGRAAWFR
jgi:hypothetical protein